MRKNLKKLVLLTLFPVAMSGCQKENVEMTYNGSCVIGNENFSITNNHVVYNGDIDMMSLEQDIRRWVEDGYTVVINNGQTPGIKGTETFTTDNWDDAFRWATDMEKKGYSVSIKQNKDTGIYTCTAIK